MNAAETAGMAEANLTAEDGTVVKWRCNRVCDQSKSYSFGTTDYQTGGRKDSGNGRKVYQINQHLLVITALYQKYFNKWCFTNHWSGFKGFGEIIPEKSRLPMQISPLVASKHIFEWVFCEDRMAVNNNFKNWIM